MSSSRNSSAGSSRSISRNKTKGKSIMKRAMDAMRRNSESNSDTEQIGPSGFVEREIEPIINIENWDLEDEQVEGSENEAEAVIERGRARNRDNNSRASSHLSPNTREKHIAYTRANPLGRMLLNIVADNLALQQRNGIAESNVNAADLCSAFYNQMEMERRMVQKEVKKVADKTEEKIISREFEALCVQGNENVPCYFSKRPKLISNAAKVEALRIFPFKNKFTGNSGSDSLTINEFFNAMSAAQQQMKLTEDEYIHMLLMCTSGKAHELIQQWSDQGENINNIYFNLSLQYDRRITPDMARTKLFSLMAPKNVDLPKHISNIMTLADRASYALPQGPTRKAYYNNEAVQALIRSLPPTSRNTASNLYYTLSAKAKRAITFMEFSRPLNTLRHTIDLDIKQNGVNVVNNNKPTSSGSMSKNKRGSRKGYSSYSVSTVQDEYTTQADKLMKGRSQNKVKQDTGNTAVVYQTNTQQPGMSKNNTGTKGNTGSQRPPRYNNTSQEKGGKPKKYCSLCGKTTHVAAQGCRNMRDNNNEIVAIQPSQNTCHLCPNTVQPRLNHPPFLCPFRPNGPLQNSR